ncbi:MAG: hypothetical protein QW176_07875, partial [Candidatus Bathyarchaeia archaeon]
GLRLDLILDGIRRFAERFKGRIISETMLIDGIGYRGELEGIARFLEGLKKLDKAYIAVPTRPPSEKWVKPAREETVNLAYRIFSGRLGMDRVELLTGYEGDAFSLAGDVKEGLLDILAVHPMRIGAVEKLLGESGKDWRIIEELLRKGEIIKVEYEGNEYYARKTKYGRTGWGSGSPLQASPRRRRQGKVQRDRSERSASAQRERRFHAGGGYLKSLRH